MLWPCVVAVSSVTMNYMSAYLPEKELFTRAGLCRNHKNCIHSVVIQFQQVTANSRHLQRNDTMHIQDWIYKWQILTFQSLPVTWCTNNLTFNNCRLYPHCIYVFCIYLRKNSDLYHLQHKLVGFYNGEEKCLLRGMNWSLNKTVCASYLKG